MPKYNFNSTTIRVTRFVALLTLLFAGIGAMTLTDDLLNQLRLDHAALRAAEDDYRSLRKAGELNGEQASDYAAYVAKLQRRVFEDCYQLVLSGATLPDDLPCPVIVTPVTQAADIDTETELSRQEQIAALDASLSAGLGEFDERLLQEQERIRAATPNANSQGGGASNGNQGQGSGTAGGDEGQDGGNAGGASASQSGSSNDNAGGRAESGEGDVSGAGRQGAGDRQTQRGSAGPGNSGGQPDDIPDGSDDDVVARQLREAAEKETDPELKAKLWEEYRKYKQGTG